MLWFCRVLSPDVKNIFASFASSWHPTGRGKCWAVSFLFLNVFDRVKWLYRVAMFNSQASQPTLPGLKSRGLASMLWLCRVLSLDVKNIFASFALSWHPTGRGKCWAVSLLWFLVWTWPSLRGSNMCKVNTRTWPSISTTPVLVIWIWICVVPTPRLILVNVEIELGQILAKDVTWLQQVVRVARGLSSRLGKVHLGDGGPWTSPLSKCLDYVPGDGWWRITNVCEILIDLVSFTLKVGDAQVVPKEGTLQMRNWTETCSLPRRLTWIKIPKTAP